MNMQGQEEEEAKVASTTSQKEVQTQPTKTSLPKPDDAYNIVESDKDEFKEETQYLTVTTKSVQKNTKTRSFSPESPKFQIEAHPKKHNGGSRDRASVLIKMPSDAIEVDHEKSNAGAKTTKFCKEQDLQPLVENDDVSADLTETTRNIRRKFMQRRATENIQPVIEPSSNKQASKTGRHTKVQQAMSKLLGRSQMKERPQSVKLAKEVSQLATLRPILLKDPKQRSTQEVKQTQKCFLSNPYFIQTREEHDEKTYYDLCQKLRLEEHAATSVVFHYGDQGKYFYIILEGSVEIRVPKPVILEEDSATPEGLISFIILYFEDIHWKEMEHGPKVLQLFYSELARFNLDIDESGSFNEDQVLKAFDREISLCNTLVHNKIFKLLNPSNAPTISLNWFKTVNTLGEGQQFGDLALAPGSGGYRNATVVCKEDTSLARLSRHDYLAIIGKTESRKKKKIVEEIKNYRIFANLRANQIAKIFLYMERKEFRRGVNIYKEGESAQEEGERNIKSGEKSNPGFGVYFIVDGEFSVTKTVKAQDPDQQSTEALQEDGNRKFSPVRNAKMKQMLRSKSDAMIRQFAHFGSRAAKGKASGGGNNAQEVAMKTRQSGQQHLQRAKQIQLYLLGKNEIFGMEEIVDFSCQRNLTVQCNSRVGTCYYLKKESFQDCVNQFRFSEQVMDELLRKHKLFKQRVLETHVFQQNYAKTQQESWNKMQAWAKNQRQTQQQLQTSATKASPGNEIEPNQRAEEQDQSDSKLELSSFLDVSEVMQEEYEMLHPRKTDTKNIQAFKRQMLETCIKPMSWKDHRNRIQKQQNLIRERYRNIELRNIEGKFTLGAKNMNENPQPQVTFEQDIPYYNQAKGSAEKGKILTQIQSMGSTQTMLSAAECQQLTSKSGSKQPNTLENSLMTGGKARVESRNTMPGSRGANRNVSQLRAEIQVRHQSSTITQKMDQSDQKQVNQSSYNMMSKAQQTAVEARLNHIQAQQVRRTIQRHSLFLMQDNILHQMITPKSNDIRRFDRQQSITKIARNMQKLDNLDKEDAEYQKFLSGSRNKSQYQKKEDKLNSTTGFSKHSGGGGHEYSAKQSQKKPILSPSASNQTAKSLLRLQTLQSAEMNQAQKVQSDTIANIVKPLVHHHSQQELTYKKAQTIVPQRKSQDDIGHLQNSQKQLSNESVNQHQAPFGRGNTYNTTFKRGTEIESITEEISDVLISMTKNEGRNSETTANQGDRSSTFVKTHRVSMLSRVSKDSQSKNTKQNTQGSLMSDPLLQYKPILESSQSAVESTEEKEQKEDKYRLSQQSAQCQILLSAVKPQDGAATTQAQRDPVESSDEIKLNFAKLLKEIDDSEEKMNLQLTKSGVLSPLVKDANFQQLVPEALEQEFLRPGEPQSKGSTSTMSRVRFINKVKGHKEAALVDPRKSHDLSQNKISGANYLIVKPTNNFQKRSDSTNEEVQSMANKAKGDSSRITFHSPIHKVDSTLPRISKQESELQYQQQLQMLKSNPGSKLPTIESQKKQDFTAGRNAMSSESLPALSSEQIYERKKVPKVSIHPDLESVDTNQMASVPKVIRNSEQQHHQLTLSEDQSLPSTIAHSKFIQVPKQQPKHSMPVIMPAPCATNKDADNPINQVANPLSESTRIALKNLKQRTNQHSAAKLKENMNQPQVKIITSSRPPQPANKSEALTETTTARTKVPSFKPSVWAKSFAADSSNQRLSQVDETNMLGKQSARVANERQKKPIAGMDAGKISNLTTIARTSSVANTGAASDRYSLHLPEYLNRPLVQQRQKMMGQIKKLKKSRSPEQPVNTNQTPYLQQKQKMHSNLFKNVTKGATIKRTASVNQMLVETNFFPGMQISSKQLLPHQDFLQSQSQRNLQEFNKISAQSSPSCHTSMKQQQPQIMSSNQPYIKTRNV